MKLYFKYSTDDWALAPMATGKNDGFKMAINKPTLSTITVNRPGFLVLASGLAGEGGWTKDNADWHFTKFVLVDDDVSAADLNPAVLPDENFESYDVTDNIISKSTNWSWAVGGSTTTFVCVAGKYGRYTADGSERAQAKYTFPTPSDSSPGTGWWASAKIKGPASGGIDWFVFLDDGPRFRVRMDSDHKFYIWNDGSWLGPYDGWSAGEWYTLKVVPISATSYDVHVNGTKIGETAISSTSAGHQVVSMALDNYNYLAGSGQYTVTVDVDDMDVSWTEDEVEQFDDVAKYWMGKAQQVIPQELTTQIICESYDAQLWREVFDEDDNVATVDGNNKFKIKSFVNATSQIELEDADGNAVSFDADEHNGRAVRITARDTEQVECIVESASDVSQDGLYDTYTESYGALDNRKLIGETGILRVKGASDTLADADAHITMLITVPRQPCKKNTIDLVVCVHSPHHTDTDYTAGPLPYLDIYDRDAEDWVRLKTWAIGECSDWGSPYQVNISMETEDFDKYWDSSTSKVTFRFYSGACVLTATGKYWSYLNITEFYITVKCYGESSPKEYIISDTANSDELTLTVDAGTYDTAVNRHSIGDKVEILFENEEWLEDKVIDYAVDINAITAPTSTAPTFSKKRFKAIGQDIKETNEVEEWYCALTRSTTGGKPDLQFVDRSSPTASGYAITPECILTNKGNILPKFNALDIVREVVISNGETTGTSGAEAVSNYPRLASTRADLPAAYLSTLATSILNQRGAVSDDYEVTVTKLWDVSEEEYVDIADIDPDDLRPGVAVDITAGNARGSATTPIDVEDVIIRELTWLPSLDACTLKLGFADAGHKSIQEHMFELIARQRYEAGLQ